MAARARREPGRLEQELLALVAASSDAVTPGQAQQQLGAGLAYTTVMTTLARLHAKGALTREPAGRGFAYRLATPPAELPAALAGRRMSRLLAEQADRAGALARFVADLSPDDEALLAELLTDPDRHDEHG